MLFDTENYDAQELSMLLKTIEKLEHLKTKVQYVKSHKGDITRPGLEKRLKSVYSPQTYLFCGITFISDK